MFIASTVIAVALATFRPEDSFRSIVLKVNNQQRSWTAAVPTRFANISEARDLCGSWLPGHPLFDPNLVPPIKRVRVATPLPTEFDARTQWPNCSTIGRVRDQGACGACWAFGSTESFESRRCILTGDDVEYSPLDPLTCCSHSMGCGGGQPSVVWHWFETHGIVTGGDYDSNQGCLPYPLSPCAHHINASAKYPECPPKPEATPQCVSSCSNTAYKTPFAQDKTKAKKAFSIVGVKQIQTAILQDGPVAAAFNVFEDFPAYKSGVYKHTTGRLLGGHAILIVGWGVENEQDYWIIKNSWNEQWGDGGFFKIVRGVNECNIESHVTGGLPATT